VALAARLAARLVRPAKVSLGFNVLLWNIVHDSCIPVYMIGEPRKALTTL
jgi:hypothetical protein